MSKVISLEDRIKQKESEIKKKSNANLNKRRNIVLSNEEILFLIEMGIDCLKEIPEKIENNLFLLKERYAPLIEQGYEDVESVIEKASYDAIEEYKNEIKLIIKIIKKLVDKFYSNRYILDKKVNFSGNEIDIYYDILCGCIDYFDYEKGYDELRKKSYYKKNYEIASEKEKMTKYLYKVFRDMYSECYPGAIIEFNEEEAKKSEMLRTLKEDMDEYKDILNYYSDSYFKEYKSKVTLLCEGVNYFVSNGKKVYTNEVYYYIKPHPLINRRLAKYNRDNYTSYKPIPFEYIDNAYLEDFKEDYPYGIGWRINDTLLSVDEFESNDKYIRFNSIYEAQREVSTRTFSEIKEFKDLEIEVLFDEDLSQRYSYVPGKIESILDSLEYIKDDYYSNEYIGSDRKIFDMIYELVRSFYE